MDLSFVDHDECNLHMVREFYANWTPETRSQYVTVRGTTMPISPKSINDLLGTTEDADPKVLMGLNIRPHTKRSDICCA